MKYKDELVRAMEWLGQKSNTIFTGQAIALSGHAISNTMESPTLNNVRMSYGYKHTIEQESL